MPTVITRYTEDHSDAVGAFNRRIAAVNGYAEFRFPERLENREPHLQYFLATDGGTVRGGFILNCQEFWLRGEPRRIAHYRQPVSEGVADRAYAGVGLQLLRAALKAEPLLYALGMGGLDNPLPRMLKATGWRLFPVPFYFKVIHPQRFLRELRLLEATPARRLASRLARFTGAGWAALRLAQTWKNAPGAGPRPARETCAEFEPWADELWTRSRATYAFIAARGRAALNRLYPPGDDRSLRLAVLRDGRPFGWAVLLDTRMHGHRQFGDLRVGAIADCLAAPEDAGAVIAAAAGFLARRGVDLIVSNQSHAAWGAALDGSGFLRGPSNYVFAASPELARQIEPFEATCGEMHMNRGDGDGPIHL